jgi:hypothetical protein
MGVSNIDISLLKTRNNLIYIKKLAKNIFNRMNMPEILEC